MADQPPTVSPDTSQDSKIPFLIHQSQIPNGEIKFRHLIATQTLSPGDLAYGDGNNNFTQLPVGTNGQYLGVSTDGVPEWQTVTIPTPSQIPTVSAVTGTTPTLDCTGDNNMIFTITLSGSTTYSISNTQAGQIVIVEVTQGSGTTYTNTWWSGITWITAGGAAPVQTTTSGGITSYGFRVVAAGSAYLGYLIGTS